LGIKIIGRHRAAGDALATVKLLEHLLNVDAKSKPLVEEMLYHSVKNLHPELNKKILDTLPEETGVYYFYDENKTLIYIGKSKNIKSRIIQHLGNNSTKKAIEMKSKIFDISYEITGSELVALLLESDEIKKNKPLYNRMQRRSSFQFGIYSRIDDNSYLNFEIKKIDGDDIPITSFNNLHSAQSFLESLASRYKLCQKLCGIYTSQGACFHFGIKECYGACIQNESADTYNQRAQQAIKSLEFKYQNFLIIDKGRNMEEKSVIWINNGTYRGFGYASPEFASNNIEYLKECIKKYPDNRDIQIILKGFVNRNLVEKIIPDQETDL
jgi:DNA polymerase III subunit epsilon